MCCQFNIVLDYEEGTGFEPWFVRLFFIIHVLGFVVENLCLIHM